MTQQAHNLRVIKSFFAGHPVRSDLLNLKKNARTDDRTQSKVVIFCGKQPDIIYATLLKIIKNNNYDRRKNENR